jgi:hypothetical protein
MIKDTYTDLIYDRRRIIIDWVAIIQAPFIFIAVTYLAGLEMNVLWIMKGIMAYVLYCIVVKGNTFLYSLRLLDNHVLEELLKIKTSHQDKNIDFIRWSKYRNDQRKISIHSILLLIVVTIILKILFPEYYRDTFLVLFYADGGLFLFMTLNNVKKYTLGLINAFDLLLNSKKIANSNGNLPKLRAPLSYGRVIGESFIVTLVYFIGLYKFIDMGTFQYIQYSMALFILYTTTRVFIQMRRYFYSGLHRIDTIREIIFREHGPE